MNSNFQPYSYPYKLQEGANETEINTSNLVYTWRVEMKEERKYKREEYLEERGSEKG